MSKIIGQLYEHILYLRNQYEATSQLVFDIEFLKDKFDDATKNIILNSVLESWTLSLRIMIGFLCGEIDCHKKTIKSKRKINKLDVIATQLLDENNRKIILDYYMIYCPYIHNIKVYVDKLTAHLTLDRINIIPRLKESLAPLSENILFEDIIDYLPEELIEKENKAYKKLKELSFDKTQKDYQILVSSSENQSYNIIHYNMTSAFDSEPKYRVPYLVLFGWGFLVQKLWNKWINVCMNNPYNTNLLTKIDVFENIGKKIIEGIGKSYGK